MPQRGLFVGLITLDLLYLVATLPERNQKIVALDYSMAAGGPATNAAIAFRHMNRGLNGDLDDDSRDAAIVLGMLGSHSISSLVAADLSHWGVTIADLNPGFSDPLPTSSILVTRATGDRSVVSINAVKSQASVDAIPVDILNEIRMKTISVVLIDGHQMEVGKAIAQQANKANIPVVVDGGSWKPGFEQVLPYAQYVICSANFRPPHCHTQTDVLAYLQALHIPHIAITNGDRPIVYRSETQTSEIQTSETQTGEIPVPVVRAVDTLGAGDILHGAFCHFVLQTSFQDALAQAAAIASRSCKYFGTRQWMKNKIGG